MQENLAVRNRFHFVAGPLVRRPVSPGTKPPRRTLENRSGHALRAATAFLQEATSPMDKDDEQIPRNMSHSRDGDNTGSGSSSPGLSRSVQSQLGQRLRHFYESLALGETPVPDRFIELINRLDEMTAEKKPS